MTKIVRLTQYLSLFNNGYKFPSHFWSALPLGAFSGLTFSQGAGAVFGIFK